MTAEKKRIMEVNSMKNKKWSTITLCIVLFTLINCASESDPAYENFLKRVQDEEPYIGFFASEKKSMKMKK